MTIAEHLMTVAACGVLFIFGYFLYWKSEQKTYKPSKPNRAKTSNKDRYPKGYFNAKTNCSTCACNSNGRSGCGVRRTNKDQ